MPHTPGTQALRRPKSSVHGLCNTLVSFGYLRRQPDGTFLIGPRVMGLAQGAGDRVQFTATLLLGTAVGA